MEKISIGARLAILGIGFLAATAANAACNKQAARDVDGMIRQMATITRESAFIRVQWGNDFRSWDKDTQLKMAQTYANSDACLSGSPREIRFYSPAGKFNAVATPTSGIRLIN